MVFNGKPCRRCHKPMIMNSQYQEICDDCKEKSRKGRKNNNPWKNRQVRTKRRRRNNEKEKHTNRRKRK